VIGIHEAATRADLLACMTRGRLVAAVAAGELIRARRDHYVSSAAPAAVVEAVRVGGRVACLSLLQLLGVFVHTNSVTHIHIPRGSSRLRSPKRRDRRITDRRSRRVRLHWRPLLRAEDATSACVGVLDALVHAVRCQPARYAVATLDSALNKGLVTPEQLVEGFAALPRRFAVVLRLVDGRAQSGPETLVRLIARSLGCTVDLQVAFDDVGYVDLLLDGWLVVECDGKEFHESWEQQVKDRARDLALAKLGYCTIRFTGAQILYRADEVAAALRGLVATRRRQS
jgi:very-short-patch-repair endonuclease